MDLGAAPAVTRALYEGWAVPPERISPMADVVAGLQAAIEHFPPPGSSVVLPTPAYMPFLLVPQLLGRELVQVPMVEDGGRPTYDLDRIDRALERGAGVVVHVNPHNPLGRVFTAEEQLSLTDVVDRHGARVFSDEMHAPLVRPRLPGPQPQACSPSGSPRSATARPRARTWPGWTAASSPCRSPRAAPDRRPDGRRRRGSLTGARRPASRSV